MAMNPLLGELTLESLASERSHLEDVLASSTSFLSMSDLSEIKLYLDHKRQLADLDFEMGVLCEKLSFFEQAAAYYWDAFRQTAHLKSEIRLGLRDHEALKSWLIERDRQEAEEDWLDEVAPSATKFPMDLLSYEPDFLSALQAFSGIGRHIDVKLAQRQLRRLAKNGNLDARCLLGMMYLDGITVKKNPRRAMQWLEEAALVHDDPVAQYYWGCMWDDGLGVKINHEEAKIWYERSGETGFPSALNNLAYLYRNGLGTEQDLALASTLYYFAAEQGSAAAQNNLGLMMQNGVGMACNLEMAHHYLRLAAEQGYSQARFHLMMFYKKSPMIFPEPLADHVMGERIYH